MIWWIGFILMALTFIVIAIDVLFIPTAVLSVLSFLGYFSFLLYVYFEVSKPIALVLLGIFVVLGGAGLYFGFRYQWWRILSHSQTLPNDDAAHDSLEQLMGETAKTISDLRPSGKILLGGKRYDAVAQSSTFIPKGMLVTVSGTSSAQLLVKPLRS